MNAYKMLVSGMFAVLLLAGTACAAGKQGKGPVPATEKQLLGKEFQLQSVNGALFETKGNKPTIAFLPELQVVGGICNRFFGQGKLAEGVLRVEHMGSTRMFCAEDELNKLEMTFHQMMPAGTKVHIEGKTLTLTQGETTLVYIFKGPVKK